MTAPEQPVTGALTEDERDRLAVIALRPWPCCPHCADDTLHGPELVNNHDLPCNTCLLDRLAARSQPPAERAGGEAETHVYDGTAGRCSCGAEFDRHGQCYPVRVLGKTPRQHLSESNNLTARENELVTALANLCVAAGVLRPDAPCTGPELLHMAASAEEQIKHLVGLADKPTWDRSDRDVWVLRRES